MMMMSKIFVAKQPTTPVTSVNVWRFSSADSTTTQTAHDLGQTVQSDPRLTFILCCWSEVQRKVSPSPPFVHAE